MACRGSCSAWEWAEVAVVTFVFTQVAAEVGSNKSPEQCEDLYRKFQTFLSIPSQPALESAFVAMVVDHYNNLKMETDASQPAGSGGAEAPTNSGTLSEQQPEKAEEDGAIKLDADQEQLPLNQVRVPGHAICRLSNWGKLLGLST